MKKIFITLIVLSIIIAPTSELSASPGSSTCRDVQFLFARGSGAPQNTSAEYQTFVNSITQSLAGSYLTYQITDLTYPAISVGDISSLLTTFISAGQVGSFAASTNIGAQNFIKFYQSTTSACPGTKWVIFGYSQGAQAITSALNQLHPDHIIYIGLFGDPHLYLPEGIGLNPPACQGKNLSSYRQYAPNCHTDRGILGARNPYVPSTLQGKIGLWCNDRDLICGSSKNLLSNSGHTKYTEYAGIPSAIHSILPKLHQAFPTKILASQESKPAALDTAFLIDTTGSMSEYIHRYKAEAIRLATATIKSGGRIALFSYRDLIADNYPPRQLCAFGCTLSEFILHLNNITISGGGDAPESLLNASLSVMNTLSWQVGATKSIVALTDAGYHDPDYDHTTLQQIVQRSLEIDPVNIYIVTRNSLRPTYADLTTLTGGQVFSFDEMTIATDNIASRPIALLPQEQYSGQIGDSFSFDASASYAIGSTISHYDWDLDGDGTFEFPHTGPIIEHTYNTPTSHFIIVRAVAANGNSSTMSAKLSVTAVITTPDIPAAPTNFRITTETPTSTTLAWQNANHSHHNLLTIDGILLGRIPTSITSVTLTDLDPAITHTLALTSLDFGQNLGGTATLTTKVTVPTKSTSTATTKTPPTPYILAPATGVAH